MFLLFLKSFFFQISLDCIGNGSRVNWDITKNVTFFLSEISKTILLTRRKKKKRRQTKSHCQKAIAKIHFPEVQVVLFVLFVLNSVRFFLSLVSWWVFKFSLLYMLRSLQIYWTYILVCPHQIILKWRINILVASHELLYCFLILLYVCMYVLRCSKKCFTLKSLTNSITLLYSIG